MAFVDNPRALLSMLEQRARRRFGQHFLTDFSIVQRMVRGAQVKADERVVEVGPGLGILTTALLQAEARITAVELDRDLAAYLRESFHSIRLVEADATKVDWSTLCEGSDWKMVANLPYNVGTHLVMSAIRCPQTFQSATVMLQQEVVNRLMASPGTKAYGALSVEAQVRGRPVYVLPVPPGSFHPPPKVNSGVVRFDIYDAPQVGDVTPKQFDRVVRASFSQRRKTIANSLGAAIGKQQAREALHAAGIDPRARAEVLDLQAFRALASAVYAEAQANETGD